MFKKLLLFLLIAVVVLLGAFFLINPIEKMRESRDAVRIADLTKLKFAVDTYISNNAREIAAKGGPLCSKCEAGSEFFSYRKISVLGVDSIEKQAIYVNATAWLPLDLSLNSRINQTPLKTLPLDPLEKGYAIRTKLPFFNAEEDFVYSYTAGIGDKYKLTAKMESKKGLENAKTDNGTIPDRIEMGTDLTLKP